MIVRQAQAADWSRISAICVEAGIGSDAEPQRARLHAEYWIGSYRTLWPEWTFVAEDQGETIGYLTACPDTLTQEFLKPWCHELPLLIRILFGQFGYTLYSRKMARRLLRQDSLPEMAFGDRLEEWRRRYPAHLHINLTAAARGKGVGVELMRSCIRELYSLGIPGCHLFCGEPPLSFYRRFGFVELGRETIPATRHFVYALGMEWGRNDR